MKDKKNPGIDLKNDPNLVGGASEVQASGTRLSNADRANYMSMTLISELTKQSPAVCFVKDAGGRYIYVNNSFEDTFNVSKDDLLGKTDESWLSPEFVKHVAENDQSVLKSGLSRQVIERAPLPDGTERDWLVWKFPCLDQQGEMVVGGVAFDITQFRQSDAHLRGQSELLELILNNIGDPVIAVDQSGKLILFNPAAIRLYGMGILGTSQTKATDRYGLFLPDGVTPYPKQELPLARAIRGENVADQEIFVRTPDAPGGCFLAAKAQPILDLDGNLKGGAAVFRDITARKRAEEELQVMVRQLKEARDEAIHASELKSQFVSNISHELRTPMSGVLGMTELLLGMDLDSEQKELATFIYDSAQNLLSVLNELLDFSRLESGNLGVEESRFSVQKIVDEVSTSQRATAARKGLTISVAVDSAVPESLSGDLRRIKQVLNHIVQNAVKFTETGSIAISVSLENQVEHLAFVKFSVTDTGIGISEKAAEQIFAPFVQADGSNTRKYGGVGLGLSIAKRIVKLMSGNMGLNSEEGKGSTFWFTIPMQLVGVEACKQIATN